MKLLVLRPLPRLLSHGEIVPMFLKAFVDHLVNWDYVDQLFSKV